MSHQDYKTYLKEKILKPSKMAHTGFMTDQYSRLPAASIGYLANALRTTPQFHATTRVGDMYMTATDMYRFDRALWTGKLINEQSKAQMFQLGVRPTMEWAFTMIQHSLLIVVICQAGMCRTDLATVPNLYRVIFKRKERKGFAQQDER
ncbi:serine hydrolase [Latilactobacillus curvatus]|uniref:serine hydrolase n=1 Tax=Latilactobacillus curvatus TaxID=28038 RepID=UPI0020A44F28|nr:serine hydrolase [Latilactobacillus curvatus]